MQTNQCDIARLDFNYSVPLRASAYDRGQPFQLGVQLNFI